MKKLTFILLLLLFGKFLLTAQTTLLLQFAATDINTSETISIDSINIINNSQSKQTTVYQSDVNFNICQSIGLNQIGKDQFSSRVYPNPVENDLQIEINVLSKDYYIIFITDVKGVIVCSYRDQFVPGSYRLIFKNQKAGLYFVSIQNSGNKNSHQVICGRSKNTSPKIILKSVEQEKETRLKNNSESDFCVSPNDSLQCICYSGNCTDTINIKVIENSDKLYFEFSNYFPVVSTFNANNINYTEVSCGGQISNFGCTDYNTKGLCWSPSENPSINDNVIYDESNDEIFHKVISNLQAGETYYLRAFIENNNGVYYGENIGFTTHNYPTIITIEADSVEVYSSKLGGELSGENGVKIINKGICLANTVHPTIDDNTYTFGNELEGFSKTITGINAFTTYYARAYVQIADSIIYGNEISFTTKNVIEVVNNGLDGISNRQAIFNYSITKNTDVTILNNGICWGPSGNINLFDENVTKAYQDLSVYSDTVFPLYPNSKYYARAFAILNNDTIFGNEIEFTTEITTNTLDDIGMIVGAVYDSIANRIFLIGDGLHKDCSPTLQQISVAFDWAYANSNYYNYLSIDPLPEDPNGDWMKVVINGEAQDTDFGWIMFEADRLMKTYSLGTDNLTKSTIYSDIPDYKNTFDLSFDNIGSVAVDSLWSRFWLYPKTSDAEVSKNAILITDASIGVQTETMEWVNGQLVSAEGKIDNIAIAYANFLTENYDAFAEEKIVFRKLTQNLRLLMIAEWIRENKIPVNPDWIKKESQQEYFIPRFTPTLSVSQKRLIDDQIMTISLFGGTDLGVTPNFSTGSTFFNNWFNEITNNIQNYTGDLSYIPNGNSYLYACPMPSGGISYNATDEELIYEFVVGTGTKEIHTSKPELLDLITKPNESSLLLNVPQYFNSIDRTGYSYILFNGANIPIVENTIYFDDRSIRFGGVFENFRVNQYNGR